MLEFCRQYTKVIDEEDEELTGQGNANLQRLMGSAFTNQEEAIDFLIQKINGLLYYLDFRADDNVCEGKLKRALNELFVLC